MAKKGTELTKSGQGPGASIVIGNTTINPQGQPVAVRFEKQVAHVYLVIDTSGSMAGTKLEQVKAGVLDFARDAFRKEYDVGLISFDSKAKHVCPPTYDMEVLRDRAGALVASGSTNMSDAIILAHECLNALKNTRVMVIATDGEADNAQDALREAARAKKDGIDIITIGTDDADQAFLKGLATTSELGSKVSRAVFSQAITSAANLLPPPTSMVRRK